MKLVKGENLTIEQRKQVFSAFIYRWTTENIRRTSVYARLPRPAMPLVSDEVWLKQHAFWLLNDGSRLAHTRHFAEPAFLADVNV